MRRPERSIEMRMDAFLKAVEEKRGQPLDIEERITAEELFLLNKGR